MNEGEVSYVRNGTDRLFYAYALMYLGRDFDEQVRNAKLATDFFRKFEARPERDNNYVLRCETLLAEIYLTHGDLDEADRLYAGIRAALPETIDPRDSTLGWCKSWCDRHDARRLMAAGKFEEAKAPMNAAVLGTLQHGHRNLSKGLTLERMYRLRADLLERLGDDSLAASDREAADLIAEHAAKLLAAVREHAAKHPIPPPRTDADGKVVRLRLGGSDIVR